MKEPLTILKPAVSAPSTSLHVQPIGSPVVSVSEMRDWEQATWRAGVAEGDVFKQVGAQLARMLRRRTRRRGRILLLAGKGHNGDDVRAMQGGLTSRDLTLLNIADPTNAIGHLESLAADRWDWIVDGLFGIGLSRPLDDAWQRLIRRINAFEAPILAVDCPSGLNCDQGEPQPEAIRAHSTVTVGAVKVGLLKLAAWPFVGRLHLVSDIGLIPQPASTSQTYFTRPEDFRHYPPKRQAATHKGTYGHVALFAGTEGYHGAAVLSARGAMRAHPGLVTVFTDPESYLPVASHLASAMVHRWPVDGSYEPNRFSALVFGPGLANPSCGDSFAKALKTAWLAYDGPVIVDASSLDALPRRSDPFRENQIRVITPHPGEAARLLGVDSKTIQADRPGALSRLSAAFGQCWVVLKGHQTLIGKVGGESPIWVNGTGNPSLAQGGSGDVLAGFLGGLLAQPALAADPGKAIAYAACRHGDSADRLERQDPGWTTEDLANTI